MNEWADIPDEYIPVCCPNCYEDFGEDVPLINPGMSLESARLMLRIVLYGTCSRCGESIACFYSLEDEPEDFRVVTLTN